MKNHLKEYYRILSPDFPDFLTEYSDIPELKRIDSIGMNCGTDYTTLFNNRCFYSRYDHSIAVALIIWNFTHNKRQTIAGLLHDIATPSFSHCIDFLHKDYLVQESTECKTDSIIESSKTLNKLLVRDGISREEINDYKAYPIADNPSPFLSADRLEYTLSGGVTFTHQWNIKDISAIYSDISIFNNERDNIEIGFQTKSVAEHFVKGASKMWYVFLSSREKIVMQFLADLIQCLIRRNIISEEDLYILSEQTIIDISLNCAYDDIKSAVQSFQVSKQVLEGNTSPLDSELYCVNIVPKKRYINPLINGVRGTKVSETISSILEAFIKYSAPKYCWFDFPVDSSFFDR
jgi:hypothetical protein